MYTCNENFKSQVQIEESMYLQVHNLGYRYLWVQKTSYVYLNIFFLHLCIFNLFFQKGGRLTLWLIVCSLNKMKLVNNFKGHPVLDGPSSLVMFLWPSSRSMHGAKNRILENHRIFHERGLGSRPKSIYFRTNYIFPY